MFEKGLEYEVRPKSEHKIEDFERGITTRLMAKRLSGSSDEYRRNSLNFPPGSFIPNSNKLLNRSKLNIEEEGHQRQRTRCNFNVLTSVSFSDTKSTSGSGITVSNLVAYREEHPEKSSVSETPLPSESPLQKMRESVRRRSRSSSRSSAMSQKLSQNDFERSSRRKSMRTDEFPVAEVRKPSPQSLKRSIDNSDQEVELLDVDELTNMERRTQKSKNSIGRVSFEKNRG
ncbi:uncharacterized protein LOC123688946 isoform X1 [Harmonia axyridis]|uniref:uncharacterized protein LOC123688946 isoform X1 n=1 Tax=Harmonia axyridis TaxID=115357 RepID=UPI001E2757B1|nr:uncharacterized protein LOC123688946 isoform X1 [Harmonia axyridis]